MSHSHLAIRHLIRQVEEYAARDPARPGLPDWLGQFIQRAAELFEPFSGVARPGFECCRAEERWEIALFLGKTEHVGGPEDGAQSAVNFSFDVLRLTALFERLETLRWSAFPDCHVYDDAVDLSFLLAEGTVNGQRLTLQVHAGPPDCAGPALRRYSDGSYVTV